MRKANLVAVIALAVILVPAVGADAGTPRCFGKRATIVGTNRGEVIRGTARADVIVALGGADTIYGRAGNDRICGGNGNDRILGGAGNADYLMGQGGHDELLGAGGFDFLVGGPGDDLLNGGTHPADFATFYFAPTGVSVDLETGVATGEGTDTILGVEYIEGTNFNDTLTGDALQNFLQGLGGDDAINGGGGLDWTFHPFSPGPVTVDLTAGTVTGEGTDTLTGIENALGSNHADSITGDAGGNVLEGGGGDDSISGLDGDDYLFGDAGDDSLDGGNGVDVLNGGPDTDTCTNGESVNNCEA